MSRANESTAQVFTTSPKVSQIRDWLAENNDALLSHTYFHLCETAQIGREQLLDIVKQLYCFSVFFERILTRRVAEFSSGRDARVARMARSHLREEIGHAELFRQCLLENGVHDEEIDQLVPKMFTKALFGYLLATVAHENEYVTNIAIMQVMETIGYFFFGSTLRVLKAHGMLAQAFIDHAEDDAEHRHLGLDLAATFDDRTMADSRRIIDDVYRLMHFVLNEWLTDVPYLVDPVEPHDGSRARVPVSHVTALRPPATRDSETESSLVGATSIESVSRQADAERRVLSFRRDQVADNVHVAHVALAKGQSSTFHLHTVTSDALYVMSGVLTVTIQTSQAGRSPHTESYRSTSVTSPEVERLGDGREVHTLRVNPGSILTIAPNVVHCTSNIDDEPCSFLCIEGVGTYDFVSFDN